MFWSGSDFDEVELNVIGKKFKEASIFHNNACEVKKITLQRWLKKSKLIQWDDKNIDRRKGRLERLESSSLKLINRVLVRSLRQLPSK